MLKRIFLPALIAAVAAAANAQTVTVGSVSVHCGDQIEVPVTVDSVSGMLSLEFRVAYDTARLTFTNAATGALTSGFSLSSNASGGVLRVAMASGTPVSGGGAVANLTFTAASAVSSFSTLTISNVLINDNPRAGNSGAANITCLQPPDAPLLTFPANSATSVQPPVVLRWSGASGASSYRVFFGAQQNPPLMTTTNSTSIGVSTEAGTTYYWLIESINDGGSASSALWSFRTVGTACNAPAAPQLSGPAEVISGSPFDLTWSAD